MGNEYPAKAYGSYNYGECDRICQGYKAQQRKQENREQQQRLDRLERQSRWSNSY